MNCVSTDNLKYLCSNLPIARGETQTLLQYTGFLADVDQSQHNFKILKVDFDMKQRSVDHTWHLTMLKYAFAGASAVVAVLYFK